MIEEVAKRMNCFEVSDIAGNAMGRPVFFDIFIYPDLLPLTCTITITFISTDPNQETDPAFHLRHVITEEDQLALSDMIANYLYDYLGQGVHSMNRIVEDIRDYLRENVPYE